MPELPPPTPIPGHRIRPPPHHSRQDAVKAFQKIIDGIEREYARLIVRALEEYASGMMDAAATYQHIAEQAIGAFNSIENPARNNYLTQLKTALDVYHGILDPAQQMFGAEQDAIKGIYDHVIGPAERTFRQELAQAQAEFRRIESKLGD